MKRNDIKISQNEELLVESLLGRKFDSFTISEKKKFEIYNKLIRPKFSLCSLFEGFKVYRLKFAVLGLVFVLASSFTTTYAYISPDVNSQSFLYPLKKSVEKIEMQFAFSRENQAKKYIKFANRRTQEFKVLRKKGIIAEKTVEEVKLNASQAQIIADDLKNPEIEKEVSDLIENLKKEKILKEEDKEEQKIEKMEIKPQEIKQIKKEIKKPKKATKTYVVPNLEPVVINEESDVLPPGINPDDFEQELDVDPTDFEGDLDQNFNDFEGEM